jgi:hypothetical protein
MSRIPGPVRREVLERDGYECVAPLIDPKAGRCQDQWGRTRDYIPINDLELDHVRVEPMMGKTAESEPAFLVTLCPGHHRLGKAGRIWATAHRPLLREYLDNLARKAPAIYEVDPLAAAEVPGEMEPSL